MTQITFLSTTLSGTTTAAATSTPTAGGPFVIPDWAPDIANISTTTVEGQNAIEYETTGGAPVRESASAYTTRSFSLKHAPSETIPKDTRITVNYQAVGELVRS